jgi:hypothetical protein
VESQGPETYSFAVDGRQPFLQKMISAGYVEMKAFQGKASRVGYWCESCPWMKEDPQGLTGYWCAKFQFPDREYGCCGGWEPMPDVQKRQRSG